MFCQTKRVEDIIRPHWSFIDNVKHIWVQIDIIAGHKNETSSISQDNIQWRW